MKRAQDQVLKNMKVKGRGGTPPKSGQKKERPWNLEGKPCTHMAASQQAEDNCFKKDVCSTTQNDAEW